MIHSWCLVVAAVAGTFLFSSTTADANCTGQNAYPPPRVSVEYNQFLLGDTFTLHCSANYTQNAAVHLEWKLPNPNIKYVEHSNNNEVKAGEVIYRNITIINATKECEGVYKCFAPNNCGHDKEVPVQMTFLDKPYLQYKIFERNYRAGQPFLKETRQKTSSMNIILISYPPIRYTFYKDGVQIENNKTFEITNFNGSVTLKIKSRDVSDSGNYTLFVTNGHQNNSFTYDIRFKVPPTIIFDTSNKTCVLNEMTTLKCEVIGYPLPTVNWIFNTDTDNDMRDSTEIYPKANVYEATAFLKIRCVNSGDVTCNASNEIKSVSATRSLLVYELPNGFGIKKQLDNNILRFAEHDTVSVQCVASTFHYTQVDWEKDGEIVKMVEHSQNQFSHVAKLKISDISLYHAGKYICRGTTVNGNFTSDDVDIEVLALQSPEILFESDVEGSVQIYQQINMYCQAEGVPRPDIRWYKNDMEIGPQSNSTYDYFKTDSIDFKTVKSNITISRMSENDIGQYECVAINSQGEERKSVTLNLKEEAYVKYVIAVAVIVFILVILLIYLTCKVKKEKRFRKELAAAGLLYFKEGVTKSLNPDLGIDEQAELLPYDERFEFPADKLVLGKQLGAGAFGVVYKAVARGIINAEESTPVAVKMVKKTADNMYIKALASELKIMVHLGKHINIVNLLGACTKNVGKRELSVIVEYCKFGNIHNYMQRHREVFIDQFSDTNKEKSFGKVNRGYDSSGSTGLQSDYGTANTQDTDHTFLTNNTNRTSRKTSEGYVQPEWRSNYESDYSYDGRLPRPLTTRDLLAWAFQIARGMEYLASRKVLHGDLAARNILLAEDNIVKICDFGLARSIYKNDEYQKKENSLLPVKWLAIECMTDRIFSTQSDVWSFGIVLWELFTLAKTPYPNMSPAHLLQFLRDGHRLERPAYSDDRVYALMRRCWEEKPTARPAFSQLQEILGTFLEDNVRNHYVDLNTAYMEGNARPEGQEDYLAMVSAPDYNNMVTPSPHHYVNERFFPPSPTTKVDEDGYLQMSPANIFSPKSTGTKFDFDSRKFNSRPSEASSGGSELTPMLTLNNLPRSGSDSDHEGNVSPFPNNCPRIEEEPDEVFDTKHNKKTLNQNAKNALITDATNPMYITCTFDSEVKKPIENSYVNMVPNGLVK